jgi:hypothetical protein
MPRPATMPPSGTTKKHHVVARLYPHTLLPDLLDFLGEEKGEAFLAIFGGNSIRVPSPAEIETRRNELHIARAVDRFHAGELDAEGLQDEARRRGIRPWMRVFHVARRVKEALGEATAGNEAEIHEKPAPALAAAET